MHPSRPVASLACLTLLTLSSAACSTDGEDGAGAAPPSTPSATTPSATVSPSPEPTPGVDTEALSILFQRSGSRRTHLAWVAPDGSGAAGVLPDYGEGNQTNPDWSPDGTQLTFVMTDGTTDDLYVARAGEPEGRKLLDCTSPCLYLDDPSWSPDGERIVYSRTVERDGVGASTLETVEVATGEVTVLLGPWTTYFTAGARWSPDGHRLVFELVSKAGPDVDAAISAVTLSVTRLDPTNSTAQSLTDPTELAARGLTDPALFAATADWSPDGKWIVYAARTAASNEATDLFLIPARGGSPQRLTTLGDVGGYAADPTFTPDGSMIVFSGTRSTADAERILLQVGTVGSGLALATGGVETPGDHPRVR